MRKFYQVLFMGLVALFISFNVSAQSRGTTGRGATQVPPNFQTDTVAQQSSETADTSPASADITKSAKKTKSTQKAVASQKTDTVSRPLPVVTPAPPTPPEAGPQ